MPNLRGKRLLTLPAWQIHAGGLGLLLAITTAAYLLELRPVLDQGHRRAALEAEIAQDEARCRTLLADLKTTEDLIARVQKYLQDKPFALQPSARLNDRLASITELATACGLQADGIEPGSPIPGKDFTTLSIRVTVRGSYSQINSFLSQARQRFSESPVVGVDMTASPATAGTPAVQCTIDVTWYTSGNQPALVSN